MIFGRRGDKRAPLLTYQRILVPLAGTEADEAPLRLTALLLVRDHRTAIRGTLPLHLEDVACRDAELLEIARIESRVATADVLTQRLSRSETEARVRSRFSHGRPRVCPGSSCTSPR